MWQDETKWNFGLLPLDMGTSPFVTADRAADDADAEDTNLEREKIKKSPNRDLLEGTPWSVISQGINRPDHDLKIARARVVFIIARPTCKHLCTNPCFQQICLSSTSSLFSRESLVASHGKLSRPDVHDGRYPCWR